MSRLFVVQTDAPCGVCGDRHEYVTSGCTLVVYADRGTAVWISRAIEGSAVREIRDVPEGISYHLELGQNGRSIAGRTGKIGTLSRG